LYNLSAPLSKRLSFFSTSFTLQSTVRHSGTLSEQKGRLNAAMGFKQNDSLTEPKQGVCSNDAEAIKFGTRRVGSMGGFILKLQNEKWKGEVLALSLTAHKCLFKR
jgi:hypothetical protein